MELSVTTSTGVSRSPPVEVRFERAHGRGTGAIDSPPDWRNMSGQQPEAANGAAANRVSSSLLR
jgi:hypothetical protein